ncbi:MAG: tRNA (adenosine(37)-N6)-threonylcarbamoyltransferase complex ATPase subunit type 1 TsaE, partial [Pseudomonadota bacterium]
MPGDCLLLSGPVGAGKTAFARAVIHARLAAEERPPEDVPSPTFTLVQTYDVGPFEIWHADLYRLTDPAEVLELGLEEAFRDAVCLIEWPDRLGPDTPPDALRLDFALDGPGRSLAISGPPAALDRLMPLDGVR